MNNVMKQFMGLLALTSLAVSVFAITDSANSANINEQKLLAGNKRYIEEQPIHKNQTIERREALTKSQHPFAVIVSCADSRVPPEIIFDQGLGDLFVVRLAGNIVDTAALASIEYAVAVLDVKYIMVLGHENCGAVSAALKGGEVPGHIDTIVRAIQPAVDQSRHELGDPLDNAIKANVALVVEQLKMATPILAERVEKGELTIGGACYGLDDGVVTMLPESCSE